MSRKAEVGHDKSQLIAKMDRAAAAPQEPAAPGGAVKQGKANDEPAKAPVPRKIKYTAEVRLIVEELSKAEAQLKTALDDAKGYVAQSEVTGSPGTIRAGVWRVRVPVSHFESFRAALRKLGEVEKDRSDSEDVTEEYYDLQAHIKNRQAEETALRKLLEQSANNMENYLSIRRELSQVRDDINRKEGRLRLLANLTDLTTITVALREKQKYNAAAPPQVAETPTFGMRSARTFERSWGALVEFVQYAVLAAIAVTPWLLPPALLGFGVALLIRRARKAASARAAAEPMIVATLAEPPSEARE